jgi:hypothetical protein
VQNSSEQQRRITIKDKMMRSIPSGLAKEAEVTPLQYLLPPLLAAAATTTATTTMRACP